MGPTLINNTFSNNGDDGIAIHGRYYLVVAVQTYCPSLHSCLHALLGQTSIRLPAIALCCTPFLTQAHSMCSGRR